MTVHSTTTDLVGMYDIDPQHSRIGFVVRHAMVTKVRGSFTQVSGQAEIASIASESVANIDIVAASVDTQQPQRDDHIRSADFLDVENFPELTFRSHEVELVGPDTYRIGGDLTIRGVSRPISIDFESTGTSVDPFGNQRAGFEGSTTIKRSDFGITFNAALETGGVMVSDKVTLEIDISAVKRA